MLLKMGFSALPEMADGHVGPLAVWINQPQDDLRGQAPIQALATPVGEDAVLASPRSVVLSISDSVATQ